MFTFICWKWKNPSRKWRRSYTADHVNVLQEMLKRHCRMTHRLICVTDEPAGVNCETYPLWDHPKVDVRDGLPNCYKRLWLFSKDCPAVFGDQFASIDLDVSILGDITHLFTHARDFQILEGNICPYNGSLWQMNRGARQRVWDKFDPKKSPAESHLRKNKKGSNFYGSDQAWISHILPDESMWGEASGVYQWLNIKRNYRGVIPGRAKMIFFAGATKPWSIGMRCYPSIYGQFKTLLGEINAARSHI